MALSPSLYGLSAPSRGSAEGPGRARRVGARHPRRRSICTPSQGSAADALFSTQLPPPPDFARGPGERAARVFAGEVRLGSISCPLIPKKPACESGCGPSPAALPLRHSSVSEALSCLRGQPSSCLQPTLQPRLVPLLKAALLQAEKAVGMKELRRATT